MLRFLPDNLRKAILRKGASNLKELRIRKDRPILADFGYGMTKITDIDGDIVFSKFDIENVIAELTGHSLYTADTSIKQGFITSKEGERVGITGTYVYGENGKITTIKEITSLCIRIPHEIIGSADKIYGKLFSEKLVSLLIFSSPKRGKTTILRDLIRQISYRKRINIVCVDERNELCGEGNFDIGETVDCTLNVEKSEGIRSAVRCLSPEVIACDELGGENDAEAVAYALRSGVTVIATAHADDFSRLIGNASIGKLYTERIFDYYLKIGENYVLGGLYDSAGNLILEKL